MFTEQKSKNSISFGCGNTGKKKVPSGERSPSGQNVVEGFLENYWTRKFLIFTHIYRDKALNICIPKIKNFDKIPLPERTRLAMHMVMAWLKGGTM